MRKLALRQLIGRSPVTLWTLCTTCAVICLVVVTLPVAATSRPQVQSPVPSGAEQAAPAALEGQTLLDAQRHFYNARYEAAAALTLALRAPEASDLPNDELRSSALLFQLKRLLERTSNQKTALKNCATCPGLITEFLADFRRGQSGARAILKAEPDDETALFFLGKLDLNYVWLQLGPLAKRTGWDEYWEARHSLDAVLKRNPRHVRARVARAWIDYIVDTKMPWGTGWLLGGGNKKNALVNVREAALTDADFFTRAEAEFALWEMEIRERDMARATVVARRLAENFPENRDVAAFLAGRGSTPQ